MAKVLLTSVYNPKVALFDTIFRAADSDRFGCHSITNNPDEATIILFIEADPGRPFYEKILFHPLRKQYPEKCFLYTRTDNPLTVMQGIYPAIPKRGYSHGWTRSGPYLNTIDWRSRESHVSEPLLFSFVGNVQNHPIRASLFKLNGPNAVVEDTSHLWPYDQLTSTRRQDLQHHYEIINKRSLFVLAPRGKGCSSIRLFEAMRLGRCPVIIADQWVEPEGPKWEKFSIRVREDDVSEIPHILSRNRYRAIDMGNNARHAWETWFSDRVIFHRMVEWCLSIKQARRYEALRFRSCYTLRSLNLAHIGQGAKRIVNKL